MKKYTGLFFVTALILVICSCAPVTIETIPAGAAVYNADGTEQLGVTPYKTHMFIRDKQYLVRKDRFFDEPVELYFDSPEVLGVRLRALPVTLYTVPDADIYAQGSDTPMGRTPTKVTVSANDKTYTLKADGFYDKDVVIGMESEDPTIINLDRRPIVAISAQPDGVELYENGKLIGTVPLKQEILAERTFELRKDGYFTQSLTLKEVPPYDVSVELEAYPVITVKTEPADASIYRGSKLLGKAPVSLPVGEPVQLDVRADGFVSETITLSPKSSATVQVKLNPVPVVEEPAAAVEPAAPAAE